jgi:hypothetical protein
MPQFKCGKCEAGGKCYFLEKANGRFFWLFVCDKGHRTELSYYMFCPFCGRVKEDHEFAPKETEAVVAQSPSL